MRRRGLFFLLVFMVLFYGWSFAAQPTGFFPFGFKNEKPDMYIALTFDDGPNPAALFGLDIATKKPLHLPGLLEILDRHNIKATFFVMGWKLSQYAPAELRLAAKEVYARGHEIENHTFGHGPFRKMIKRFGEEWVLRDIEKASQVIKELTGRRPSYVRPPEWNIWPEIKSKIEERGYRVMARESDGVFIPPLFADVDTEDYRHYELNLEKRPRCLLEDCVKEKIIAREKRGIFSHILVFHELPLSAQALDNLIPWLKRRGYKFLTLDEYMSALQKGGS
jgi:peptidoglycan/xylan/chitin deacetylase (PgdA/CDA1 family)